MKVILPIAIITIFSFLFTPLIRAQECVAINSVTISEMQNQTNGTYFKCVVNVDSKYAGSENVACGLKNDTEAFPKDYCPSSQFFGGWSGSTATFNCVIPPGDVIADPAKHPQVVAYDFSNNTVCGPDKGKSISLTGVDFKPNTPQVTENKTTQLINDFLKIFFSMRDSITKGTGGGNGSGDSSQSSNTPDGVQYPVNANVETKKLVEVINSIVAACGNVITTSKANTCLDNVKPPLPNGLKQVIIRNSIDGSGYFQCVGAARLATIVMGYPQMLPYGPGTACNYSEQSIPGYTFIPKGKAAIQVGDIPIWGSSSCAGGPGHIAFVTQVYDSNNFQIAEANYTSNGYLGLRNTTLGGSLKGWLRPN